MGAAIGLRDDVDAEGLRRLARRSKDAGQARRLLALAAVRAGETRARAAEIGGMDRQTLRDWVHRFNARGVEGLSNIKPSGRPPRLSEEQKDWRASPSWSARSAVSRWNSIFFEQPCGKPGSHASRKTRLARLHLRPRRNDERPVAAGEPQRDDKADALSVEHLCVLAGVARAGYYRWLQEKAPQVEETGVRDAIQRIALAKRHYGYRRIAAELRREGRCVNRKRVLRLMREDNLLCLRRKPFVPATTDSRHGWRVVPKPRRRVRILGRCYRCS